MIGDGEDDVLDQLQSSDEHVRRVALESLALRSGSRDCSSYAAEVGQLLETDDNAEVRRAAARALASLGSSEASRQQVHALLAAALRSSEEDKVRAASTRAVGLLLASGGASSGGGGASALANNVAAARRLQALAQDGSGEEVQLAAVEALASLGQAACLAPFFNSVFVSVCRSAVVEVGRSPSARLEHLELLAGVLAHRDTSVRLAAVQASGEVGLSCSTSLIVALGRLGSTEQNRRLRHAAVQALGRSGDGGVTELLKFLSDVDEDTRHFAAETLGSVGGEKAAASAAALLCSSEASTRCAALQALGKMNAQGRAHSKVVAMHISNEDLHCRLAAIQALSDLGDSSQAGALGMLTTDANKGVRQAAVTALAKMDVAGAAEAVKFFEDDDQAVRQAAVKVFSPLHSKLRADLAREYSEVVACRMLDEDWRVRLAAVVALGDLHAVEFVNQVGALCGDGDAQVRRSAVTTLHKLGAGVVRVAAFLGDDDAGVRGEAQRVYALLGGGLGIDDDGDLSEVE